MGIYKDRGQNETASTKKREKFGSAGRPGGVGDGGNAGNGTVEEDGEE